MFPKFAQSFGKILLDLCRFFFFPKYLPQSFCSVLLHWEVIEIYLFLILSYCIFFILRNIEQTVDNINLLGLPSLFRWVKRELWEFLYLSFAYSTKKMDYLLRRVWIPFFKSDWEKELRILYINHSLRYMCCINNCFVERET